jgi:hypothetical protein
MLGLDHLTSFRLELTGFHNRILTDFRLLDVVTILQELYEKREQHWVIAFDCSASFHPFSPLSIIACTAVDSSLGILAFIDSLHVVASSFNRT